MQACEAGFFLGSMGVGKMQINDNAAGAPQIVSITASTYGEHITLSPTSLSFGKEAVGASSAAKTVTLHYPFPKPNSLYVDQVEIDTATLSGDFSFDPTTTTCRTGITGIGPTEGYVPVGTSCTWGIIFKPTVAGTLTGTLSISDNAAVDQSGGTPGESTIHLSGTGVRSASKKSLERPSPRP